MNSMTKSMTVIYSVKNEKYTDKLKFYAKKSKNLLTNALKQTII